MDCWGALKASNGLLVYREVTRQTFEVGLLFYRVVKERD
jgi:hypothetical protein